MKNLAIAGLGWWGQTLVGAVQGASELVRFTVGVARRPEAVQAFAARRGLRLVPDLAAALSAPDVDGLVVTTPDRLHVEHALAALQARKPVLVDKPFALEREGAEAVLALARETGTLVAFGHNRRFLPAVREMAARIESGWIGRVLHVEANFSSNYGLRLKEGMWRADPAQTAAGGMAGMGIHHIDLMIRLVGRVARVRAEGRTQVLTVPVLDNVGVRLEFENGATGTFATLLATAPLWRFRVLGSEGWIEMIGENRLLLCRGIEPVQEIHYPVVSTERAELEAFARAIDGAEPYPVSGEDALHGVSVLEAVDDSLAAGRGTDVAR